MRRDDRDERPSTVEALAVRADSNSDRTSAARVWSAEDIEAITDNMRRFNVPYEEAERDYLLLMGAAGSAMVRKGDAKVIKPKV